MATATNQTADHRQQPMILSVDQKAVLSASLDPGDDRELPFHLKRTLGPARPMANDPVSRRIFFLLRLHPDIGLSYSDIDFRRLRITQRQSILEEIESRLSSLAIV